MDTKPNPIDFEEADFSDDASYEQWFRDKVEKALRDNRPTLSHEEVMAEMRALIEAKRKARKRSS